MKEINENQPIPQGKYIPATKFGNIIYTAGMTPRKNGVLIETGKISKNSELLKYSNAVKQAAENTILAAKSCLNSEEQLDKILLINVYVNATEDFQDHSKLADYASEYYNEQLGDLGVASRAAIGVASLPGNAPVEIQLVISVKNK